MFYAIADVVSLLMVAAVQYAAWRSTGRLSRLGKGLAIASLVFVPFVMIRLVVNTTGDDPVFWIQIGAAASWGLAGLWLVIWAFAPELLFSSIEPRRSRRR